MQKTWGDAESFASAVEQLPESRPEETFAKEKYGTCYKNLHGVIEHTHYHLGQIVLIKKAADRDKVKYNRVNKIVVANMLVI